METLNTFLNWLNGIEWGVPTIVLIVGTGLYLQLRLSFMTPFKIVYGFLKISKSCTIDVKAEGKIAPSAALLTARSATSGTGNIAGHTKTRIAGV